MDIEFIDFDLFELAQFDEALKEALNAAFQAE